MVLRCSRCRRPSAALICEDCRAGKPGQPEPIVQGDRLDTQCGGYGCHHPLTACRSGGSVTFHSRPRGDRPVGPPIAACPGCKRPFPNVTWEELTRDIFRT